VEHERHTSTVIRSERFGDVTRYELTNWRCRAVRLSVSVYAVRGALIDTGSAASRVDVGKLLDELRPRGVIITHYHEDHAGNVEEVAARGVPLAVPAATLEYLRNPKPIAWYRRFTWGTMPPLRSASRIFVPDDLALRHTPGHSDDHHVVWDAATSTLFSADLFLGVKVRIAHLSEDPRALTGSLRRTAALEPERMFDAHRGLVERPSAMLRAKADWLEGTIAQIDSLIESGADDEEIRHRVLGGRDLVDIVSRGDYTRLNFVKAVRRTRKDGPAVLASSATA
jgi:glyoxylase-like metal-dependent hydrolase (beta-lactamase superfamily II)